MRVTSLTLCFAFSQVMVEALTSTFEAVTSSSGKKLCAVSKPTEVVPDVRNVIKCGAICMADELCKAYSFKDTVKECDLFDCTPPGNYSTVAGCSSYILRAGSRPPRDDCSDIQHNGCKLSGVYKVCVNHTVTQVYCDMETDGGGWLVFQRRKDGSVDFYRSWADYTHGFGSLTGEFWLGNDNINLLTSAKRYTLRIDLSKFDGTTSYATYDDFVVNSATDYRLASIGNFNGPAGDSLVEFQLGQPFSTNDTNNQPLNPIICSVTFRGAWWYGQDHCHRSNLNGYYYGGPHSSFADGVNWYTWTDYFYSLKTTEMKIRPT